MTFEAQIASDWPPDSPVGQACLAIWNGLNDRAHRLDHYSFAQLSELANRVADGPSISRALLYLAAPSVGVLKTALMYEFEGAVHELPEEEQLHFARGQNVVHPILGETLQPKEILLAFELGERLESYPT